MLEAKLIPLVFAFKNFGGTTSPWHGYLNFDLSDGHVIGIDELFNSPSAGLAALSTESRKLLDSKGHSVNATRTAPDAGNFAFWTPTNDGLKVDFQSGEGWPAAAADGGISVTIPWSALDKLIKPDSPIRSMMP